MEPNEFVERHMKMTERLSKLSKVTRYDEGERKEADTLAHAFLDLQESFKKFNDELLPLMEKPDLTDEQLSDLLHDVGEEFRHILYHIKDPKLYRYLWEEID